MSQKTLDEQISDEIGKNRFSEYTLQELLEISRSNNVISDLFRELSHNRQLCRLLTLHRLDLFGIETTVKIPYLFLCNLPKSKTNSVSKALRFIITEEIENADKKGMAFLENIVNTKDEEMLRDLQDVLFYFLIGMLRQDDSLVRLINAPEFNYRVMKKELKDYESTKKIQSYFGDVISDFSNPNVVDPEVVKKIEKLVLLVVSGLMSKVDQTMDHLRNLFPDITMYFQKQSILWLSSILEKTKLSNEAYVECLDILFRIKAIENKHILTWCEACNKHEPSYSVVTGKIAPSNLLTKKECMQCNSKKQYSFSGIYGLSKSLNDIISSKDGILTTYFAWLLDKKGISFELSRFANEYETDVLIKKKYLVECKVFRVDKDENSVITNIKKAFGQLERQIKSFESNGISIKKAYLLWNLEENDKNLRDKIDNLYRRLRSKYGFKIVAYHELDDLVSELH